MATDNLRSLLLEIKAFCKQHGLGLFKSEVIDDETFDITWDGNKRDDAEDFLAAFAASGARMLHYQEHLLEHVYTMSFERIYKNASEEKRPALEGPFQRLLEREGHLLEITLFFYHDGSRYEITIDADWIDDYYTFVDENDGNEEVIASEEETEASKNGANRTSRNKTKVDELARAIFEQEGYQALKKETERRGYASQQVWKLDPSLQEHWSEIVHGAEQLFQSEIQAKRNEEILEKLKALKLANPKLTKANARGVLGLTERELEKFWYQVK